MNDEFLYNFMNMSEMDRSDAIQELFNSKTINFANELDKFSNEFASTFSNALEADANDPDAGADDDDADNDPDAGNDDKNNDPDAGGNDKDSESDPDANAGGDDSNPDAGSDEGNDPDYTKGSDPDAGGGGSSTPAGGSGNVEPPKNEEEKDEKNKDISERIHLFKNYKRLAAMTESLINGMQGFIDYALSIEDRNVVLRIKQELIKTSGQLEFAMALNFKTADKEKLEELYEIINKKIQTFVAALEKVRKAKQNPQK